MMSEKKVYGIYADKKEEDLYEEKKEKLAVVRDANVTLYQDNEFEMYSLNEMVLKAQANSKGARLEVLNRLAPLLTIYSNNALLRNNYVEFSTAQTKMGLAAIEAIEKYDPSKGDFLHFLRAVLSVAQKNCSKESGEKYYRDLKYFGHRIQFLVSESAFYDSESEDSRQLTQMKVDVDDFLRYQPDYKVKIFRSYLKGHTLEEIAEKVRLSKEDTSMILENMLDEFRKKLGVK